MSRSGFARTGLGPLMNVVERMIVQGTIRGHETLSQVKATSAADQIVVEDKSDVGGSFVCGESHVGGRCKVE